DLQAVMAEVQALGGQALAVAGDIADPALPAEIVAASAAFGGLDALVSNAGFAIPGPLADYALDDWDKVFAVHVRGAFLCCKAALPYMLHQKHGCILNLSSMWGQVGASCEVAYSAAKAAVIGLTKALAKEEGPSGITVNCIAPGVVDTPMLADFSAQDKAALADETPLCRIGTPQDIANAALFLASDAAAFITGQVLGVNGGFVI
ncbi:MAG: SDR family oxidoreductase, partial [Ruthenibacterium sp.]